MTQSIRGAHTPWRRIAGGLLMVACFCTPLRAQDSDDGPSPVRSARLADLPLLPRGVSVHQISSHNKKGLNGDSQWHLYTDDRGDAVIFDAVGPGCARSIWGTDIQEDAVFRFYLDDDEEPRFEIDMLDFYKGKHPLFPAPLVSFEKRGYWGERPFAGNCFVPIPFAQRLRIAVKGKFEFYHVVYERYPHGTAVETFTGKEDRAILMDAFQRLGEAPAGLDEGTESVAAFDGIDPLEEIVLLESDQAGCIRAITLECDGSDAMIGECEIRMTWDEHLLRDVSAPVGFFFGSAVRATNMRTLPMRMEKLDEGRVRMTSWFPMPFWSAARVTLINRSSQRLGPLSATISVGAQEYPQDRSGYFTALYRRGQTTYGRDWLFCESPGTGWFVGAVQSMQGEHYCEGDEHFRIDGAISPQINGTGTEDYYLACFWSNREFNSPFANCVGDVRAEAGGTLKGAYTLPSCYSRFHLDARIQHGGQSHIRSNYGSIAFYYLRKRPALVQTDYIDVGCRASEAMHDYKAPGSVLTGVVEAHPEGGYFQTSFCDEGRSHAKGAITLSVAVSGKNKGVRLRRRLDQKSPRQCARVFVDGTFAGTWYHPDGNEHLRWFDAEFDIHPSHTAGKERLDLRLEVVVGEGRGAFTDFAYWVDSFVE